MVNNITNHNRNKSPAHVNFKTQKDEYKKLDLNKTFIIEHWWLTISPVWANKTTKSLSKKRPHHYWNSMSWLRTSTKKTTTLMEFNVLTKDEHKHVTGLRLLPLKLWYLENIVHIIVVYFRPTTDEETLKLTSMLLSTPETYRQIVDFDNHFDDLSRDWRNQHIGEFIERCTW